MSQLPTTNWVNPNISPLQWKNTLLTKELSDDLQNPINFIGKMIRDNDAFSFLFERIQEFRDKGKQLPYFDRITETIMFLEAFVVVQDLRGVNWICPITLQQDPIAQRLRPLDVTDKINEPPFRGEDVFGDLSMPREEFFSACSRGFENASKILLGDESAKLHSGMRLVACFCFVE